MRNNSWERFRAVPARRGGLPMRYCDWCGNAQVTLRIANPSSGDTNSQIGLEAPIVRDMQISPAAGQIVEANAGR